MNKRIFSLLLFFALAPVFGNEKPLATVGSKNFPENYILGEILAEVIQTSGEAKVKRRFGMGGTGLVYQALTNGKVDVYPEYTGTISQAILKDPTIKSFEELQAALAKKNLVISQSLGFNNTYALAVKEETAEKLNLKKISDLKNYPKIKIGFSYEFMNRADGLPALKRAYKLNLKNVRGIEHSLAYEALDKNQLDLIDVYTTDAKLEKFNLALLEDDLNFFPRYDAVVLARQEFIEDFPQTWKAIKNLEGKINGQLMSRLNAMADIEKRSFKEVAAIFLSSAEWIKLAEREKEISKNPDLVDTSKIGFNLNHAYLKKLLKLSREHIFLVFFSLVVAIFFGVPLGILSSKIRIFGHFILNLTGVLQTIPSLALLCFLIPFLGVGLLPALVALFLYALLPIVRSTYSGLMSIDPKLIEASQALGLSGFQTLKKIQLPIISIHIMSGIKTSAVINVGTATLAAFIGAGGYGSLIVTGLALNDIRLILQGALPAALLAILVNWFFEFLDMFVIPKGLRG